MPAFTAAQIAQRLLSLPGWQANGNKELVREFTFKNYYETMAFVNAVAYIAHGTDHHPDLEVHYNRCRVRFSTHDVGGVSEKDFASAARVNELVKP